MKWLAAAMVATASFLTLGSAPAGHGANVRVSGPRSNKSSLKLKTFTWTGRPVSPKAIPLGDGHVSTSPKRGYVDSCVTQFNGKGANGKTPWIDKLAMTWDARTKPTVEGAVSWPSATHTFSVIYASRVLSTNDLPEGEKTGTFPIQTSDPAYQYDQNPNTIVAQSIIENVPASPRRTSAPECLNLGPIGVTTDGVVLFDALDGEGRDAGAHEILDACDGHPAPGGVYHYHVIGSCLTGRAEKDTSVLVGYALDGYGIYAEWDSKGNLPTDADLDACHGRTSTVEWDGKARDMYHYDVTLEYPYTVGCFHGSL